MRKLVVAILSVAALLSAALSSADSSAPPVIPNIAVSFTTQDPANAFVSNDGVLPTPILFTCHLSSSATLDETVQVALAATDYWGASVGTAANQTVTVPAGKSAIVNYSVTASKFGAYIVDANVTGGNVPVAGEGVAIVVPPPHAGLRPDSYFASNTYMANGIELHSDIGLKIYRQHFADSTHSITQATGQPNRKPTDPFAFDFTEQDKYVADAAAGGISIVGIVGYANQQWGLSDEGRQQHMYGPPRDINEFINATIPVVAHFKTIKYWEFWNEPWIYGWSWAGTPSLYRQFQGDWIRAAKRARPDIKVIAGNSASFLQDNIEPDPYAYKGIQDAESNHPYRDMGDPSERPGAQQRYMDFGVQEAARMGIPMHFITENGSDVGNSSGVHDDPLNAPKLVVLHIIGALAGEYQGNIQQDIGWGPKQLRGSAAYAIMTHFLEDRVPVADIWPKNSLIWGAVFANSKYADPSMPRAKMLSARWKVPDLLPNDATKVAVVWNYTGSDEYHPDNNTTLTIPHAEGMKAYDLMGNPIGNIMADRSGSLTVPFTQYPVYITSDSLSVKEFAALIGSGRIDKVTPVTMYAFSFTQPVDRNPALAIRVENQMNRPVTGTFNVTFPPGWSGTTSQKVTLAPAQLTEIDFPVTATVVNPTNLYDVTVDADTDAGKATLTQVVQAAYAPNKTIGPFTGNLQDWAGITPVTIDSDYMAGGADWSQALLNPNRPRPDAVSKTAHVLVKAYTAWDATNFYAAFAVTEPELTSTAGTPFGDPKFKNGMLDGINHPIYLGDAVEFVFGINERAEDDYHKPGDPWYWKGDFRDTDYQYFAYPSTDGPQLLRLHKPGIPYRDGYQAEMPPGQGPIPGSRISITRTGDVSLYEISIPRTELALFKPERQPRIRFGFLVANSAKAGNGGLLEWSRAAGVWDYWENSGSYQPTWQTLTAAQTAWGFGR